MIDRKESTSREKTGEKTWKTYRKCWVKPSILMLIEFDISYYPF
jgi:hypothetical protein